MSSPRIAYFHEDDYCQVELLPAGAADYCRAEMTKVAEFAEQHFVEGAGWTDMYIRGAGPVPVSTLKLSLEMLRSVIEPTFAPFDEVMTGYASYRERATSCKAWGDSEYRAIFASFDGDAIARAAFFGIACLAAAPDRWASVLSELSRRAPLLIADWNQLQVVLIDDAQALTTYLGSDA